MPPELLDANVFRDLYSFRPRGDLTPHENFLTEALVYVLRRDDDARDAWLRLMTGTVGPFHGALIQTRNAEQTERGTNIYPDVLVKFVDSAGSSKSVVIEHKWDAGCDLGQLAEYAGVIERRGEETGWLVFVGAYSAQLDTAAGFTRDQFPLVTFRALSWLDIYCTLDILEDKSRCLTELLEFMMLEGLGPAQPLTTETMLAYIAGQRFLPQLTEYANKLRQGRSWTCLPPRYLDNCPVQRAYGRIAIVFGNQHWAPAITAGFLFDNNDHAVPFTDPKHGIDIFLRIEATPKTNPDPTAVLTALAAKRPALEKMGAVVRLLKDKENGNRHTLLIAQYSLATVLVENPTETAQLDAIYGMLHGWLEALFADGELEKTLVTLRP